MSEFNPFSGVAAAQFEKFDAALNRVFTEEEVQHITTNFVSTLIEGGVENGPALSTITILTVLAAALTDGREVADEDIAALLVISPDSVGAARDLLKEVASMYTLMELVTVGGIAKDNGAKVASAMMPKITEKLAALKRADAPVNNGVVSFGEDSDEMFRIVLNFLADPNAKLTIEGLTFIDEDALTELESDTYAAMDALRQNYGVNAVVACLAYLVYNVEVGYSILTSVFKVDPRVETELGDMLVSFGNLVDTIGNKDRFGDDEGEAFRHQVEQNITWLNNTTSDLEAAYAALEAQEVDDASDTEPEVPGAELHDALIDIQVMAQAGRDDVKTIGDTLKTTAGNILTYAKNAQTILGETRLTQNLNGDQVSRLINNYELLELLADDLTKKVANLGVLADAFDSIDDDVDGILNPEPLVTFDIESYDPNALDRVFRADDAADAVKYALGDAKVTKDGVEIGKATDFELGNTTGVPQEVLDLLKSLGVDPSEVHFIKDDAGNPDIDDETARKAVEGLDTLDLDTLSAGDVLTQPEAPDFEIVGGYPAHRSSPGHFDRPFVEALGKADFSALEDRVLAHVAEKFPEPKVMFPHTGTVTGRVTNAVPSFEDVKPLSTHELIDKIKSLSEETRDNIGRDAARRTLANLYGSPRLRRLYERDL